MLKLAIYWGSWALPPLSVLCLWALLRARNATMRVAAAAALTVLIALSYARFVEPRLLVTHEETIVLAGATPRSPSIRIALFADTHIGMFANAMPVKRIVRAINKADVDAVFLAGDLTYHPKPEEIADHFAALGALNAPLFVVLGNHDVGYPGPDLTDPLLASLADTDAIIVHNRAVERTFAGSRVIVAGVSDLWQQRQDYRFAAALPKDAPVLVLTHNPDTALAAPPTFAYDLMLAGHTHGGQVRLPFLYPHFLPVAGAFDKELHVLETPAGERLVYVTTGTGMVGLPLRFLMPPRLDILTLHLPEARSAPHPARRAAPSSAITPSSAAP